MKGAKVSNAEAFVFGHYLLLLKLLKMGIPYDTIMQMDEDEVYQILGVEAAIADYAQGL